MASWADRRRADEQREAQADYEQRAAGGGPRKGKPIAWQTATGMFHQSRTCSRGPRDKVLIPVEDSATLEAAWWLGSRFCARCW